MHSGLPLGASVGPEIQDGFIPMSSTLAGVAGTARTWVGISLFP